MTVYYADPEEGANLPMKSRLVSGENVVAHDIEKLPGTVETDITASKDALAILAAAVASARVAVDLPTTPTANLATIASAIANLATIVANQAPPTAIYGGKKTVTTAGLSLQLQTASQALTEGVWVRALDANAGLVYVGNLSISATAGGTRLAAKEAVFIRIDNLNKVYVDVATNGEGVTFLGW